MTDGRHPTSASLSLETASRRDFLKGSTAAVVATGLTVPLVHAAGSDTIKVGLVGCGGRGSGATEQCLTADFEHQAGRHGRRLRGPARGTPLDAQGLTGRLTDRRPQGPPGTRDSKPTRT